MTELEDRLARVEAQVAEAMERIGQHGPEHDLEAVDPMVGRYQEKDTAGAPTNEAPAGTRCHVTPDNADYVNQAGGTVWTLLETGGAGAPTGADYLTGSSQGSLSNEIVVGPTPGGDLGGTWASPQVDAVHSGSPHHDEGHTLASHATRRHSDLSDAPIGAHHTKYTDADAVTAVPFEARVTFGWLQAPQRITP